LRIAISCSKTFNERQRHGSRRIRLDLMNGMHIAVPTTVADNPQTPLSGGLAPQRLSPLRARTSALSVISALPFTV
jgi:hypothetical protein